MIINYLIKALCEKESVYVNNLGLFRKEYEPARISGGLITPPGYKVVFDPDYDGNGFAFTMFVSQKGSMLITEATSQIDQWVQQLKKALDNNKSVSFENFGTFAKGDNGNISCVCDRIAELNVEYEGMEPIALGKKREVEREVRVIDKDITDFKEEKEETETEKKEEIAENEHEKDIEENGKNGKRWLVWVVVLLLLALLAATAYYFKDQLNDFYHQYFGTQTEGTVEEPVSETVSSEITPVDSTLLTDSLVTDTDSITKVTESGTAEEQIEVPETSQIISKHTPVASQLPNGEKFFIDFEKGKHYVIVGSFRSEKEVRKHIKDRKLEQYNPKVVMQQNSKNMRICVGVFDNEADADRYGRSTGLNYWVLN